MSVAEIKALMRARRLNVSGRKSKLIESLLAAPPLQSNVENEVFKCWFLKPRQRTSDMKVGSANEGNIASNLPEFFSVNSTSWTISQICEAGLCSKVGDPQPSTSVGCLAILSRTVHDVEDASVAIVEFKTMTQMSTERAALTRVAQFSIGHRVIEVDFGSALFKTLIWTPAYRCQVLHYMTVFSVSRGVFVVASSSSILYAVIVTVSDDVRSIYTSFTRRVSDQFMSWFNGNTLDKSDVPIGLEYGHAVDLHTVSIWKGLARSIRLENEARVSDPGRMLLRPAHDIKPKLVALWNRLKGKFSSGITIA